MLTYTHSRLHCPPLRKFHASHIYSGKPQASVRLKFTKANVKATLPRPSLLKDKKATIWKRNERKSSRNESFPTSIKLSSILRRHNQSTQHQSAVGGESTRSRAFLNETRLSKRLALDIRKGKVSSTNASTKWVLHPRTSENDTAGASPFFSGLFSLHSAV